MKKTILTLAVAAFTLTAVDAVAQDKVEPLKTEVRSAENIKKEADALKKRIEDYTVKVEANKDNGNLDYEAETKRIGTMKAKWEELTGKSWEPAKKVEKL
ncbi:MAG: hypothetical protein ACI8VL_001547 [Bacteroidia bacterium]|jgi:hypothetical protein